MPSVNAALADAAVSHSIDLAQYSNGVVRRMLAILNRADADIFASLSAALEAMPEGGFTVERLESLLTSVRALNSQAYAAVGQAIAAEMSELAAYEAGHQLALFTAVLPPQVVASVGVAAVNVEQVYAAAMARPWQGRLLKEWAQSQDVARMSRIRDQVRMGFIEQEPIAQIVRRIRGTKAAKYSDGLIEIDRRQAETIVRTAVSHTAGFVREKFMDANADIIKAQQWSATLDTRVSEICLLRDGKQYEPKSPYKPIGHKLPWLGGPGRAHFNCRSSAVPITKSWAELGGADLPAFSTSQRASMDGTVPAEQTYGAWLKRQSAARQDEVLGPTRAALFRRGDLPIERFANAKGIWLSLDELRARDAEAFRNAGI